MGIPCVENLIALLLIFQGGRFAVNLVLPNYFEFSRGDFMILASLFGMFIYGEAVIEVYNPLEEKRTAEWKKEMDELQDKYLAEFRKIKETQDKGTSSQGDPNLMV